MTLSLCRDPNDNHLLECCLAGEADLLITGDRDLLELEPREFRPHLPRLRIISPRRFLETPVA